MLTKQQGRAVLPFLTPRLVCVAGLCAAVGQGQLGPLMAGHPSIGNEALNTGWSVRAPTSEL